MVNSAASAAMTEVPIGYYIHISSGPTGGCRNYRSAGVVGDAKCHVTVYRSLDAEVKPPVEHVKSVGTFVVEQVDLMPVPEFLDRVRLGIERVIKDFTL